MDAVRYDISSSQVVSGDRRVARRVICSVHCAGHTTRLVTFPGVAFGSASAKVTSYPAASYLPKASVVPPRCEGSVVEIDRVINNRILVDLKTCYNRSELYS